MYFRATVLSAVSLVVLSTVGLSAQSLPTDNDQWGARCASLVASGGVPNPDPSGITAVRFEELAREESDKGQHLVACNLYMAGAAGESATGNAEQSRTDITYAKVEQKLGLHKKLSFVDKMNRTAEVLQDVSKQTAPATPNEMYAMAAMVQGGGAPGAAGGYPAPQGQYLPQQQAQYPPPEQGQYPPQQQGQYAPPPQQGQYQQQPQQQGQYQQQPQQQGQYPQQPQQGEYAPPQQGQYPQQQPQYPQQAQVPEQGQPAAQGQPYAPPQGQAAPEPTPSQPAIAPPPQQPTPRAATPAAGAGTQPEAAQSPATGVSNWSDIDGKYVCYYYGYTGGSHYIGGMLYPNLGLITAGIDVTVSSRDAYDSNFGPGKFNFSRMVPGKARPEMMGTITFVSGDLRGHKALLQTHDQFKHAIIFPAKWKMPNGKSDAFGPSDTWCYQKH